MPSKVKVSGAWRDINRRYRRIDGRWRSVRQKYVKSNGVWKLADTFFSCGEKSDNIGAFIGTRKVGVLDNGDFGAQIQGRYNGNGQTLKIGIRVYDIPEGASISFTLEYSTTSPAQTTLYVQDIYGYTQSSWSNSVSDHAVSWSYWSGGILDLNVYITAQSTTTIQFSIKNFRINGVLQ